MMIIAQHSLFHIYLFHVLFANFYSMYDIQDLGKHGSPQIAFSLLSVNLGSGFLVAISTVHNSKFSFFFLSLKLPTSAKESSLSYFLIFCQNCELNTSADWTLWQGAQSRSRENSEFKHDRCCLETLRHIVYHFCCSLLKNMAGFPSLNLVAIPRLWPLGKKNKKKTNSSLFQLHQYESEHNTLVWNVNLVC